MKRSCSVYFRPDGVYVLSMDLTTTKLWISNGYSVALSSPPAEELTAAIKSALAQSKTDVPLPEETHDVPGCVRARGVKSWKAFEKGAQPFGIRVANGHLIISIEKPYKSGGFLVDREETYPENAVEDIGTILWKSKMSDKSPILEQNDECPFKVGDKLQHLFRGGCVVTRLDHMHEMMPTVTVRFPNGEEHRFSLPCPILKPVTN